jgi:GDPmannose 4,6-dehydratase
MLGKLNASYDLGFASNYVEAMWSMLQQEKPDDYVIASGETHTVREFIEIASTHLGLELNWEGKGAEEKGIDKQTGKIIVGVDPHYFRPAEVDYLLGDASKAKNILGWTPSVKFNNLIEIMVKADVEYVNRRNQELSFQKC